MGKGGGLFGTLLFWAKGAFIGGLVVCAICVGMIGKSQTASAATNVAVLGGDGGNIFIRKFVPTFFHHLAASDTSSTKSTAKKGGKN